VVRLVVENVPKSSPIQLEREGIPSVVEKENEMDLHVIELVLNGEVIQHEVIVVPPAFVFAGSLTMGQVM
jgi:hypothetical protein